MIQIIFFALLVITLLGGFFAYYAPSQKGSSPVKFVMDNTGYSTEETLNHQKSQQINVAMSRGLMQIRRQMDDLAVEQNKFLDTLQDQQQILKNATKDANGVLLEAKKEGKEGSKDVLQLEALTSEMQNEQDLLVSQGQDLVSLNNQLMKNRELIAEQVGLENITTEGSLYALQQRSVSLNNKASSLFDEVSRYDQEARDQMDRMKDKLQDIADNTACTIDQQSAKERIRRMMEHERDERQREEDQQSMIRQRIADQEQRMQDQQNQ